MGVIQQQQSFFTHMFNQRQFTNPRKVMDGRRPPFGNLLEHQPTPTNAEMVSVVDALVSARAQRLEETIITAASVSTNLPILHAPWNFHIANTTCNFTNFTNNSHEELKASGGTGIPHHMFGVISQNFTNKGAAYKALAQAGVCRHCRNSRAIPCAYISKGMNGSCLFCMITMSNEDIRDRMCSACNALYTEATANKDYRANLLDTLLKPLVAKLRFCVPSYTVAYNSETRTAGFSTTGNGLGEARFDLFITAKTPDFCRIVIGLEIVSSADITPSSLMNKAAYMRVGDYGDAPLVIFVVYVNTLRPLSHLVLVRQVGYVM